MLPRTTLLLTAAALALGSAGCDSLTRPRAIEIAAEPMPPAKAAPAAAPAAPAPAAAPAVAPALPQAPGQGG